MHSKLKASSRDIKKRSEMNQIASVAHEGSILGNKWQENICNDYGIVLNTNYFSLFSWR